MSARTIDEVQDTLDGALGWRRTELLALKRAIAEAEAKSAGSPLARGLARAGIALLYAHWEGFTKEACQCYVDYVTKRRLKHNELNDGLLLSSLMALSRRAATGDHGGIAALLDVVRRPDESRAVIPKRTMVDTRSNLRYVVLEEIFATIGLSMDKFMLRANLIDKTLCDGRNAIAHGRDYYPAAAAFEDLHSEVIDMIEDVRDVVMAAVRLASYRRPVA